MARGTPTAHRHHRARIIALCLLLSVSVVAPRVALALNLLMGASNTSVILCTGSGLVRVSLDATGKPTTDLRSGSASIADAVAGSTTQPDGDPAGGHCALASTPHPAARPLSADLPDDSRATVHLTRGDTQIPSPPRYAHPAERAPPAI